MDALSHVSYQGRLFGGADAYEVQRGGAMTSLLEGQIQSADWQPTSKRLRILDATRGPRGGRPFTKRGIC